MNKFLKILNAKVPLLVRIFVNPFVLAIIGTTIAANFINDAFSDNLAWIFLLTIPFLYMYFANCFNFKNKFANFLLSQKLTKVLCILLMGIAFIMFLYYGLEYLDKKDLVELKTNCFPSCYSLALGLLGLIIPWIFNKVYKKKNYDNVRAIFIKLLPWLIYTLIPLWSVFIGLAILENIKFFAVSAVIISVILVYVIFIKLDSHNHYEYASSTNGINVLNDSERYEVCGWVGTPDFVANDKTEKINVSGTVLVKYYGELDSCYENHIKESVHTYVMNNVNKFANKYPGYEVLTQVEIRQEYQGDRYA